MRLQQLRQCILVATGTTGKRLSQEVGLTVERKLSGPYGGDNHATIHVDCIFSGPELEADGRSIPIP